MPAPPFDLPHRFGSENLHCRTNLAPRDKGTSLALVLGCSEPSACTHINLGLHFLLGMKRGFSKGMDNGHRIISFLRAKYDSRAHQDLYRNRQEPSHHSRIRYRRAEAVRFSQCIISI